MQQWKNYCVNVAFFEFEVGDPHKSAEKMKMGRCPASKISKTITNNHTKLPVTSEVSVALRATSCPSQVPLPALTTVMPTPCQPVLRKCVANQAL